MESGGDKRNTWGFLSGMTYRDERESRIVAIRFLSPAVGQTRQAQASDSLPPTPNMASRAHESPITYRTDAAGPVRVEIVTADGRPIRLLSYSDHREAGSYSEVWDWRSDTQIEVRDGTYRYNIYLDNAIIATGVLDVRWPPN
jgi:hypothetical protein